EGALRYTGRHHFGVEVENMAEAHAMIEKAGAVHRPYPGTDEMAKRGNVEVKFKGPDGVTIDLSEHGWLGTK
ncbi:MAG: VOC family protein, partial [Candidatus Binatia bacterium]